MDTVVNYSIQFIIALASAIKGGKIMALPTSFNGATIADNTLKSNGQPETATYEVPIITITDLNQDVVLGLVDSFNSAVAAIILGNAVRDWVILQRNQTGAGPASSIAAQRENKLLCRYHDNTTFEKFRVSLPTFDLTKLPAHSEFLALGSGVGAAWKTAFEALVVSPSDDTHTVTLDSCQFVGRNT